MWKHGKTTEICVTKHLDKFAGLENEGNINKNKTQFFVTSNTYTLNSNKKIILKRKAATNTQDHQRHQTP